MNNIKISFALFLFFFATFAEGSLYKWVDDKGITHYSTETPTNRESRQIKAQPATTPVESGSRQPSVRDWQANERLKNYKEKRDQQEAAENQQNTEKARRCAIAKERLDILQRAAHIYRTNDKGEKEYLDDDVRDAETKKMQAEVANNC